jgi:ABC-type transport system involved in multi-copper enzyme maturation permease subunit
MISRVARKDILEGLLSLRSILSLLMIVTVFAISGFVFVSKYQQQLRDYSRDTNQGLQDLQDRSKRLYGVALYEQAIYRTPKMLTLCAEGHEESIPNCFRFNAFSCEYPEVRSRTNVLLSRLYEVDWTFITSVFLSFSALICAYNSCCGERENGTLRLMLASPLPRYEVLLGKYVALLFMVGVPFLLGILINLVIVLLSRSVVVGAGEWLRIFSIVVLSFLYLSVFVLLGLFVSSSTSRSASSMVTLLFLWVGMVIVIPSFGTIVAKRFRRVPTQTEMQRRITEHREQWFRSLIAGEYGTNAANASSDMEQCNPPARARAYTALTDERNRMVDEHLNQMVAQVTFGQLFTRISPTEIYRQACETIAGTGIQRFAELRRQVKRYQIELAEYVRGADAKDPASLHLLYDEIYTASAWKTISHNAVNSETVPKFREQDMPLGQSLQSAIWDIGLLILFNLVSFAAALVSFLRYDVR